VSGYSVWNGVPFFPTVASENAVQIQT